MIDIAVAETDQKKTGKNENTKRGTQKEAIVLHPYSSDVLNNIGVLLSESGKRDDAIKYFKKALSYMPSHPDARKNMEDLRTV